MADKKEYKDIYSDLGRVTRTRPYAAYRFIVEAEQGGTIKGAFTNFSGVKATTQTATARSGSDVRGVKDNIPGITEYQHVTLSKGVIGSDSFLNWLKDSTAPGLTTGPQGTNNYRNLRVIALDDQGNEGMVWTLQNAIPVGYQLEQMDASRSEVLCEHIEFAITGVKRDVKHEGEDSLIDYNAYSAAKKLAAEQLAAKVKKEREARQKAMDAKRKKDEEYQAQKEKKLAALRDERKQLVADRLKKAEEDRITREQKALERREAEAKRVAAVAAARKLAETKEKERNRAATEAYQKQLNEIAEKNAKAAEERKKKAAEEAAKRAEAKKQSAETNDTAETAAAEGGSGDNA